MRLRQARTARLLPSIALLVLLCAWAPPAGAIGLRDLFAGALGVWRSTAEKVATVRGEEDLLEGLEDDEDPEEVRRRRESMATGEEGKEVEEEGKEEREEEGKEVDEEGKEEGEGEKEEEGGEGSGEAPAHQQHPLFHPLHHHHHHPGHHHHPVITIYATMTHYIQVTSTKHTVPMCVTAAVPSLPTCPAGDAEAPHLEHSIFSHLRMRDDEEQSSNRADGARSVRDADEDEESVVVEESDQDPESRLFKRKKQRPMNPMSWSLFGQKHHHVHHHIHKTKKGPVRHPLRVPTTPQPHPLHPMHPAHPMNPVNVANLANAASAGVGLAGAIAGGGWWGGRPGWWGGHGGHGGHIVQHHGEPYLGPHHHHHLVTELLTKTKLLTKVVTKVNGEVTATLLAQNCLPNGSEIPHCDAPHHDQHRPPYLIDSQAHPQFFYGHHPDAAQQQHGLGPVGPFQIPNPPYEAFYTDENGLEDGGRPAGQVPVLGHLEPSATPLARQESSLTPPLLWEKQLTGSELSSSDAGEGSEVGSNSVKEE